METCAVVRRWCCQPCQNCWYSRAFAADQSISRVLCKCCATCLSSPLLLSSTELLSFRFGLLACCLCWCHWLDPDQMPVGSMAEMGTQHHRASQDDKKCDWTWLDQSWIVKCSSSCFKALRVRKTSGVWRYGSCPESVPSPWMKHKPQKLTIYVAINIFAASSAHTPAHDMKWCSTSWCEDDDGDEQRRSRHSPQNNSKQPGKSAHSIRMCHPARDIVCVPRFLPAQCIAFYIILYHCIVICIVKFRIVWNRDLWGNSLPRLLCENATGAGTLVSDMGPWCLQVTSGHHSETFWTRSSCKKQT